MPRPNVLFIIADQHRYDFVGYETGNGTTLTPALDALARRGAAFGRAYCTAPLCSPSRAALALGRYGLNSGCFTNLHEPPAGAPSFVSQLRAAGYATCAVGKTHYEIHAYDSDLTSDAHRAYMDSLGWDEVCEISGNDMFRTGIRCAYSEFLREEEMLAPVLDYFRQWHYFMDPAGGSDPPFTLHEWMLPERFHSTTFVADRALDWLARRDRCRPFFLHVGFSEPHSPINPPLRQVRRYDGLTETMPHGAVADPRVLRARTGCRAAITHIDEMVGRLVQALDEAGELEQTVIVYTSDHGDMAGDHGRDGKTCFFEGSVRVPLIIAGPGVRAARSEALVELLDLGRTCCDLAGVETHALDQGRSLAPLLHGETTAHRDTLYAEMGCDRMLCDGRWKLMWGDPHADARKLGRLHLDKPVTIPPSPARLYDLQSDPHELHDLAGDPAHQGLLLEMAAKLLARLNENLQPQPLHSRGEYRPLAL